MGDEDAVEALSGTGCVEGGVIAAIRGKSSDDPALGGRGAVGARPLGRRDAVHSTASGRHKLDPYKGIIDGRLEEFPRLSARRLFEEVRAAGYTGGYVRVRDYVRARRPREPVEAVVRFETPAGRQGQVDFATFTLPWGRRYALVMVLSHSRLLWLRFYRRQTMAVLIEGLESAFGWFGGVGGPAMTTLRPELLDELLTDYERPEDLLGEEGLFKELKRALLERALGAELSDHLGYEKGDPAGRGTGNSRNGHSDKRVLTEDGEVNLAVPRDRQGTFEPVIVPKGERRLEGFDERIVSLYARGMTVREIRSHLEELYGGCGIAGPDQPGH